METSNILKGHETIKQDLKKYSSYSFESSMLYKTECYDRYITYVGDEPYLILYVTNLDGDVIKFQDVELGNQ